MTIFVAFGHKKRVGKDTAARFLCSYLRMQLKGSNIQLHGYADKGKAVCHDLYAWAHLQSGQYYEDNPKEKEIILPALGKSPRQIWIDFMSTAIRNHVYDLTWVKYLMHNINCDVCIVKDLRFPVEADIIHEHGGYVFRIERDAAPNDSDLADDALLDFQAWDQTIYNNGTLAEFNKTIEQLGEMLLLQLKKD